MALIISDQQPITGTVEDVIRRHLPIGDHVIVECQSVRKVVESGATECRLMMIVHTFNKPRRTWYVITIPSCEVNCRAGELSVTEKIVTSRIPHNLKPIEITRTEFDSFMDVLKVEVLCECVEQEPPAIDDSPRRIVFEKP